MTQQHSCMRGESRSISSLLARLSSLLTCISFAHHCHASVISTDEKGNQRRWPLHVPAEHLAHTNIINPANQRIRYFISGETYSKTNNIAELNAVRAAFDQWQSLPGSALKFEEGGLVQGAGDVDTSDNTNLVAWAKESLLVNNGRDNIRGVLAITYPRLDSSNVLLEADIILNGVEFHWFTDFFDIKSSFHFIEATVAHEIGHFIGLEHSPVGGATMFARGDIGVSLQAGLSSDELSAAHALYPIEKLADAIGALHGMVTIHAKPLFGAMVFVENIFGHIVTGTVTRRDGQFQFSSLPPGMYNLRVAPLHSAAASPLFRLISSQEISPAFAGADTDFLPSANLAVQVSAGSTYKTNITVVPGSSPLRVTGILLPRSEAEPPVVINGPVMIPQNATNLIVGIATPDVVAADASLEITGPGLALGQSAIVHDAFPGSRPSINLISARIRVLPNATPGLRSFLVRSGAAVAYANGFLEILPEHPDYNFDGLDDRFQRRHFTRFTSLEASPAADPDSDQASNQHEFAAATLPLDASSVLRIERITTTSDGTTVFWTTEPGRSYQMFSRAHITSGMWEPIGEVVKATEKTASVHDPANKSGTRFYRVEIIPK